jgi:hypothetical protein
VEDPVTLTEVVFLILVGLLLNLDNQEIQELLDLVILVE